MSGTSAFLIALMLAPANGDGALPAMPEAVLDGDPVTVSPPADAVVLPKAAPTPVENAPDPALLALQPAPARLYRALAGGASDEEVGRLVATVAVEIDMNCPRVREYQVYRATTRARTLKIKCEERPLFAVTVGVSGEAFVSGGDGTIGQMRLADGPIKTMMGVRMEDYIAERESGQEQAARAAPQPPTDMHPGRVWLVRLAAVAGVGLAGWIAYAAIRALRQRRRSLSRWRGLDSDSKDMLVEESEEIYDNLYRHPAGIFIARGRRGKRRLFPSLVLAYLYSSRGIKLFEIR